MLVLSRGTSERIVIGEGIEVTVISISRNKVRLGITAPEVVPVHRAEVAAQILSFSRELDESSLPDTAA